MHESYKKWLEDGCPKIYCICGCKKEIVILEYCKKDGMPKYIKNHNKPAKGCIRSEETKQKIRNTLLGKMSGNKNPIWIGGTQTYWRKQRLIKDNYTCQICNHREPEIMVIDHIKPKSKYPELKYDINNLITLCPNCHARKSIKNKDYNKEM